MIWQTLLLVVLLSRAVGVTADEQTLNFDAEGDTGPGPKFGPNLQAMLDNMKRPRVPEQPFGPFGSGINLDMPLKDSPVRSFPDRIPIPRLNLSEIKIPMEHHEFKMEFPNFRIPVFENFGNMKRQVDGDTVADGAPGGDTARDGAPEEAAEAPGFLSPRHFPRDRK